MNTAIATYRRPGLLGRSVLDDFFGDAFINDFSSLVKKSTQGYPVADIYRAEDGSTIMEFALAGFDKSDLNIDVRPDKKSITISASSESNSKSERRIARRGFSKTFVNYDNNLDLTKASADFKNGLLTVTVPVRPEVKPVSISIG